MDEKQRLENNIIRMFILSKDLEKKIRNDILTTKKELDEQAYKNYIRGGYLARKMARLGENEDENEEEMDKVYESQSALSLKEDKLREALNKFYDQNEKQNELKEEVTNMLLEAVRLRDVTYSDPYLPPINGYSMKYIERLVRELRRNKK